LQKAQTEHQVDVKGRRERIALIKGLGNSATGFAQAGVIDRHAHQAARAIGQGAPQHVVEQCGRIPLTAGVQEVLARPVALLAAVGSDDARQTASAQTDERTEGLADGAAIGTLLGEVGTPSANDIKPGGE
jgi:hypothetical protein